MHILVTYTLYLRYDFKIRLYSMIEITYIWHDCFVVNTDSATLVFDYWKDLESARGELPDFLKNADLSKPIYVFVSHHHKDHYNPKIFQWDALFQQIRFIVSKDVAKFSRHLLSPTSVISGEKPNPEHVTVLKPGEEYNDSVVRIKAFASTDIGNSYLIEIDENTIFHAGDLNAWVWKDESTGEEVRTAIADYQKILNDISGQTKSIDYAMFPVDPRIGTDFATGAVMFLKTIDVNHFFPMHFELSENEEERKRYHRGAAYFAKNLSGISTEIITLQSPYSTFVQVTESRKRNQLRVLKM